MLLPCILPPATPQHRRLAGAILVQKQLNDMALQSLTPGEYWDVRLPGFGVRVGKRSTTFLLKKGGRRIKLGNYPSLSLAEAAQRGSGALL
jgi:hypothetical protein